MQRVLEKMAQKLNSYDEASLMQLWQHFATQVHEFEPCKRWEEAAIALCLIQAVHWKNQLFNYHLALTASPAEKGDLPPLPDFFHEKPAKKQNEPEKHNPKATVLAFPGKNGPGADTSAGPGKKRKESATPVLRLTDDPAGRKDDE